MNLIEKNKLTTLLNKALGQIGKSAGDNELTFICPFHNAVNNISRRKFGVSFDGQWNCFACGESGKSFRTLFKKLKVSSSYYKELYTITGDRFRPEYKRTKTEIDLRLPEEFLPLYVPSTSIIYKHALNYIVKKRGLTRDDILRYNIGYCDKGYYRNRIIIPSYDKDAQLNFFVARDIFETSFLKYLMPSWSKDIIGFELFINWDEPITIVESAFNAITIRKNTIPLFGKLMSDSLKSAIIENGVLKINVCLDKDAEKDTIKMVEDINKFTNEVGIEVHIVELSLKDPNEIGFEKMNELINIAPEADFEYLFKKKINLV